MLKWNDIGIILNVVKKGEKGNLVCALTRNNGRHMGWMNSYSKKNYILQPGDIVNISWNSRVSGQLGFFKIELIETIVGKIFNDEIRLNMLASFCSINSVILPEREVCKNFFDTSKLFIKEISDNLSINEILKLYVLWELEVLNEIGSPLNIKTCAVSGNKQNLKFVSPKSGKAVGSNYAGIYEKKLLKLPFILGGIKRKNDSEADDIFAGFELTLFFIKKFLITLDFNNLHKLLSARDRLQNNLKLRCLYGRCKNY